VALLVSTTEAAKFVERQAVEALMEAGPAGPWAPDSAKMPFPPRSVEHCPDFNERFTLTNGKTRAIPYPQKGWNCNPEYGMAQTEAGPAGPWAPGTKWNPRSVEHCPDFSERFTLVDGKTRAIPHPQPGWNCNPDWGLAQVEAGPAGPWAADSKHIPYHPRSLEHCPDFSERFTLVNGKTRAIPYPLPGYNCNPEYGLAQTEGSFDPRSVEHCPDFDERFTLTDGRTRAIPYPQPNWNCNPEWSLTQRASKTPTPGPWAPVAKVNGAAPITNPDSVELCPDFNERFTLKNGRTRAIPWPRQGWNCNNTF